MTSDVVTGLVADLHDEFGELAALLEPQPESAWRRDTPATGWTVRDQVAHLAHFDQVTRLCIAQPAAFVLLRDGLVDLQAYVDGIGLDHASRAGADMLRWWSRENALLRAAALEADPAVRVPWFGPSMSLASKLTARIMETWAHGQDVVDALGLTREPTGRLRHIARIGILAFANSFRVRGLEVPEVPLLVRLDPPGGGKHWIWGDPAAADVVTGSAEDFCLVVTQRRHVSDTALDVQGEAATRWMAIAQAFAGPPGQGREPGQFPARVRPARPPRRTRRGSRVPS
ncbi:TIGR03084 family metal-binding protein [Sphaerisporangium sp. NPDC051017]|uniref:TIGR03084 family metal-binding protein n=1 Tax=Sphaerisporangium sp. NPDC051017 TaxID=3154636 RepID=UPI003434405D